MTNNERNNSELSHAKRLLKECPIAGVIYHLKPHDELWDELEAGAELALLRDRKNKYDKNAVAVALASDYDGNPDNFDFEFILGYLPKEENAEIAALLDMGWESSLTATLSTVNRSGDYANRLRISIFIQSREPQVPHYDGLRIITLSQEDLFAIQTQLEERGVVYRQWNAFPSWKHDLPDAGEEVMVYAVMDDNAVIYRLKVLAKGEDCMPLLSESEKNERKSDSEEVYILSNICGPVALSLADNDALGPDHRYTVEDVPSSGLVKQMLLFFDDLPHRLL